MHHHIMRANTYRTAALSGKDTAPPPGHPWIPAFAGMTRGDGRRRVSARVLSRYDQYPKAIAQPVPAGER